MGKGGGGGVVKIKSGKAKQTFPRADQVKTHSVFLLALEPPGAPLADDGVLPEGLTLLTHQVVVGPLGQLRDLWDVIVD